VILTAVGAADEIHVFRRYRDLGGAPGGHRDRVRRTLEEMAPPVVRTSVTTAVAFLSFAISPLAPVRSFGLFTAFGVLVCMVFSLTVVPALLVQLGPKPWGEKPRSPAPRLVSLPPPAAILIAAAVLAVAALDGIRRLRVQDSWIDGFAPGSAFARATRSFDEQFLGSHLLRLMVEVDAPRLAGEVAAEALGARELEIEAPAGFVPARLRGSWLRVFQLDGETPREWTTWVDDVQIQDGADGASRLTLAMPKIGGSPRFWLRPAPGERLGYEVRSEPLAVPEVLERIADLERHVGGLPEVGGVLGPARYLATVGFMLRPGDDGSRRLPDDPRDAKNRWQNYGRVRGEERLRQLVDDDRRRALITVFLEGSNYADTERLMDEIRAFEAARLEPHGIRLGFAGDVAVSQATIDAVVTTEVRSLLLSLAGIVAVTAVAGRSLRRGLLSVVPPAFAVLLGFAAMGWLGVPLGVATSTFAAMTLGVGVDFAIHLLARFEMARRGGLTDARAIAAALAVTGPAIVIDAVAVGLGFATLMLSEVPANVRLGGLLTTAVLGCLAATLLLVPALLAWFPGPSPSPPRSART